MTTHPTHIEVRIEPAALDQRLQLARTSCRWPGIPVRSCFLPPQRRRGGYVDEDNTAEEERHTHLLEYTRIAEQRQTVLGVLRSRLPVFVYFNSYFRVRPNLHLLRFTERIERNLIDDAWYDYGSQCLLKLLGFSARELADLGSPPDPGENQAVFESYRSPLDERRIKLNAASVNT